MEAQPRPPFSWSLEQRIEYARGRVEKCAAKYPELALMWLRSVELLESQRTSVNNSDD